MSFLAFGALESTLNRSAYRLARAAQVASRKINFSLEEARDLVHSVGKSALKLCSNPAVTGKNIKLAAKKIASEFVKGFFTSPFQEIKGDYSVSKDVGQKISENVFEKVYTYVKKVIFDKGTTSSEDVIKLIFDSAKKILKKNSSHGRSSRLSSFLIPATTNLTAPSASSSETSALRSQSSNSCKLSVSFTAALHMHVNKAKNQSSVSVTQTPKTLKKHKQTSQTNKVFHHFTKTKNRKPLAPLKSKAHKTLSKFHKGNFGAGNRAASSRSR